MYFHTNNYKPTFAHPSVELNKIYYNFMFYFILFRWDGIGEVGEKGERIKKYKLVVTE